MIPGLEIIFGGITGLLGNFLTSWMNLKTLKLKNEHDAKMIALETAAMKEEAKMNIAITKAEIEGTVELADSSAYMESIKAGNKAMFSEKWIDKLFGVKGWIRIIAVPFAVLISTGFAFVDWLRGFMRPALTLYLTIMSTYITYHAWQILDKHAVGIMSLETATDLYNETTSIIIYLTVSCVTWWFGDRRMAKFLTKIKSGNE